MQFRKLEIVESVGKSLRSVQDWKKGEGLIVTDTHRSKHVELFATLAWTKEPRSLLPIWRPGRDPAEAPPDIVARAMLGANVIFELTQQWIGASKARIDACADRSPFPYHDQMSYPMWRKNGPAAGRFWGHLADRQTWLRKKFTQAKKSGYRIRREQILTASIDGRMGRTWAESAPSRGLQAPPTLKQGSARLKKRKRGHHRGRNVVNS